MNTLRKPMLGSKESFRSYLALSLVFYESPPLVSIESYSRLFLGVHDNGPISGDGLSDGFAGYQEESEREVRNSLERGLKKGG